ncbi:MAG TPA: metallophosphoesterase [Candidatus Brocadiia bacterium]|nr:metallophosphoesterase [Candidatus Brocadiia bacterium]
MRLNVSADRTPKKRSTRFLIAAALILALCAGSAFCDETRNPEALAFANAFAEAYAAKFPASWQCDVKMAQAENVFDQNMLYGPLRPVMRLTSTPEGMTASVSLGGKEGKGKSDKGGDSIMSALDSEGGTEWLTSFAQPLYPPFWSGLVKRLAAHAPSAKLTDWPDGGAGAKALEFGGVEIEPETNTRRGLRVLRFKFLIDGDTVLRGVRAYMNTCKKIPLIENEDCPPDALDTIDVIICLDFSYAKIRAGDAEMLFLEKASLEPLLAEDAPRTAEVWTVALKNCKIKGTERAKCPAGEMPPFAKSEPPVPPRKMTEAEIAAIAAGPKINEEMLKRISEDTPPSEFCFTAIADLHKMWDIVEPMFKEMEQYQPRFCIVAGDMTEEHENEYQEYVELIRRRPFPVISVPGNHDMGEMGRVWYKQYLGREHFYFDYGPLRIVGVDSSLTRIGDKQLDWLRESLKTDKTKIVFNHHPTMMSRWWPHAFFPGCLKFMQVCEEEKVALALSGHSHLYAESNRLGTTYMMLGASGRLPPPAPTGAAWRGFAVVKVGPDGLKTEFIKSKAAANAPIHPYAERFKQKRQKKD